MEILVYGLILGRSILLNLDMRIDTMKKIIIPDEQLRRIIDIDESCLSLGGSEGIHGGRLSVQFFNRGLPYSGIYASKSSVKTDFITGISAAVEALNPHFQFSTKSKERNQEKIRTETVLYMKNI